MQTLKFLLINYNNTIEDADCIISNDRNSTIRILKSEQFALIFCPIEFLEDAEIRELLISANSKIVIIFNYQHKNIDYSLIKGIHNFEFTSDYSNQNIYLIYYNDIEQKRSDKQNQEFRELLQEENKKLKEKIKQLTENIEKRQKSLIESRSKLFQTNNKLITLKRVLISLHESISIGEIENNLNKILSEDLKITWTRIFFSPQDYNFESHLDIQSNFTYFKCSLYKNNEVIGSVFFLKPTQTNYSKNEKSILSKIAEAISLALDRINKLNIAQDLKEQWEATFNAISSPFILIDQDYNIVQKNNYVQLPNKLKDGSPIKCYKVLFDKDAPCSGCKLNQEYQINNDSKIFQVQSQQIKIQNDQSAHYINFYRDITEEASLEKKLVEQSKMAELGTIASSIAHELNNPLGGIISFLQLIKMDVANSDPIYEDIVEMEQSALKCKDIIQNLLGFART